MIPWQSLHVVRSSGLPVHGSAKSRALQAWRTGTGDYRVTHGDWQPASPDSVDWAGFTVPPPRRGGRGGVVPESARGSTLKRCPREAVAALLVVAERTGETWGEILVRVSREELVRQAQRQAVGGQ